MHVIRYADLQTQGQNHLQFNQAVCYKYCYTIVTKKASKPILTIFIVCIHRAIMLLTQQKKKDTETTLHIATTCSNTEQIMQ